MEEEDEEVDEGGDSDSDESRDFQHSDAQGNHYLSGWLPVLRTTS